MKTGDEMKPKNINAKPDYKKEYYKLQEENHMLKKENHMLEEEIKKYKEALLKICLKF